MDNKAKKYLSTYKIHEYPSLAFGSAKKKILECHPILFYF